ncbi:FAD/NAD(P)-binding protein [Microbacterium allomyrinae]|nr:FAD/NAD(P)-binding protein [Microbacterium allomyrinae]
MRIAVIGMGPRGTAVVERMAANLGSADDREWELHLIDPHPHGPGRIWHDAQSRELVMNTVAGEIGLFTDATSTIDGPIVVGPNLYEWSLHAGGRSGDLAVSAPVAAVLAEHDAGTALDPELRAEIAQLRPWSHPTRVLYGRYLEWCLQRAIRTLPAGVTVHRHECAAVALAEATAEEAADGHPALTVELGDGVRLDVDAAILALGWLGSQAPSADVELGRGIRNRGLTWIEPASPIEQDLDAIGAGEHVVVRGLGMGFFDMMALVTVGRGGRFIEADPKGGLRYEPSGREPRLHVGSRRGVPFRSKPLYAGFAPSTPQAHLGGLRTLAAARRIDFAADAMPLIRKDAVSAYYTTLARESPGAVRGRVEDLLGLLWTHDLDSDEWLDSLARHVPDPRSRLDLKRLLDPARPDGEYIDAGAWRDWVTEYIDEDLAEGHRGSASALKAAAWSIGCARGLAWDVAGFGGLWGESHARDFLEFVALGNMLGSGPPAFRMQQLRALIAAGVVNLVGPRMRVHVESRESSGVIVAESPAVPGSRVEATVLVDAWMQMPRATGTTSPLLRSLIETGMARPFRVSGRDGTDHITGGVEITEAESRIVAADGSVRAPVFLLGIPAEEVRGNGTASPIPGSGGTFLREADAATRAALAFIRVTDPPRGAQPTVGRDIPVPA